VQNALSLGYVKYSEKVAEEIIQEILGEHLNFPERVFHYEEIVNTAELESQNSRTEWEDQNIHLKKIKNQLLNKNKMINKEGKLDPELENDLKIKNKIEKDLYIGMPQGMILWDMMLYYLSSSYDRRSKTAGPFPYLRPQLDTNQLKTFKKYPESAVKFLKKYHGEKIEYVKNLDQVLSFKFEIERKTQGLHFKMDPALGAAILTMKGHIEPERSAEIFQVPVAELEEAKNSLETFEEPTTNKAKRFLEMVKG
jgi:Zn-finger domain-containing protein